MPLIPAANPVDAVSSVRMLAGTIATLVCAFLLVLVASFGVIASISRHANHLEAERQRNRVEAALAGEGRIRDLSIDNRSITSELVEALSGQRDPAAIQKAFMSVDRRLPEFEGSFIVTPDGTVLAGMRNGVAAGQADYDELSHLAAVLPGNGGDQASDYNAQGTRLVLRNSGSVPLLIVDTDLANMLEPSIADTIEPLRLIGYRRLDDAFLRAVEQRYRITGLRLTATQPEDVASSKPVAAPDGRISRWLSWTPDRPGDMMIQQFILPLSGVAFLLAGILTYAFLRLRTATTQIATRERQIQRLAGQDELSLLPNRRTFDLRLDQELAQVMRGSTALAVMLLDLDRFKAVNDTYGHKAGDELIRQVAQRLRGILRGGDTVARLGGDEFGIIQTRVVSPSDCVALGERILSTLTKPFNLLGVEVTIGCSIGIALAPQNGKDREALMRLADTALYQSKNGGRNRYSFFEAQMNRMLQLKRVVEDDLRRAIAQDELTLHYQPQVSVDGSTIVGVEALVRWPHPQHGLVAPAEFISIAEERGLIVPLGEWVLRRACTEAKRWPGIRLAVNVSPIQFRQRDFVETVLRIVEETGFERERLELELTEGVVVEDADGAEAAMMDLRAAGIKLALDDFGTGYSSLIYLRRFAFDKIKIDRSFLEYMESTGESAILVHSIAHLGRALGLRVCAEGVETEEQHRFLQAIGCHELQGFLFAKAVTPDEIDLLLEADLPFAPVLAA